jgi:mono/diheme cytochrome c family protein
MKTQLAACWFFAAVFLGQSVIHAEEQNEDGRRMYQTYCAGCHGSSGKGDGPAAKTLPVKPADHTRAQMSKYTDQYLFDIISKGGASVGKSAQMPAWGAVIKESQIKEIVAHIRNLSSVKKETHTGRLSRSR